MISDPMPEVRTANRLEYQRVYRADSAHLNSREIVPGEWENDRSKGARVTEPGGG
jgi:hypothetical protein